MGCRRPGGGAGRGGRGGGRRGGGRGGGEGLGVGVGGDDVGVGGMYIRSGQNVYL